MITLKTHHSIPPPAHPQGFNKCVWMESGVVSYKLCPFQYNCEACPFDQALRARTTPSVRNGSVRGESKRR